MKIPTLLALTILSAAIVIAISSYLIKEKENLALEQTLNLRKIVVANIQPTSASIIWESSKPMKSIVIYGVDSLDNEKSSTNDKEQTVHLVQLDKLNPQTSYKFKIKVNDKLFPQKALEFKTPKSLSEDPPLLPPLRGSVLNENFEPLDNILVVLKIPGTQDLATVTASAGNFIIPLVNSRKSDFNSFSNLNGLDAKLLLSDSKNNSQVIIRLPINDPLPPLIINQNIDLRSYLASNSAKTLTFKEVVVSKGSPLSKYDLNSDGKINAVDFSIIVDNFGKNPKDKNLLQKFQSMDFNNDGKINQGDTDAFKKALQI